MMFGFMMLLFDYLSVNRLRSSSLGWGSRHSEGYVPITCCMGRPSASCKQREIFTSCP